MTEKYIPYTVNGRVFDIPESMSADFEKKYPNATIEMHVDDKIYDIPLVHKSGFLKKHSGSNVSYAFDKEQIEQEKLNTPAQAPVVTSVDEKDKEDRTGWIESGVKGLGSGITRFGKGLFDAAHYLSTLQPYVDPETGEVKRPKSYAEQRQDKNNHITAASRQMGATAERLSKEADPTHGEKEFSELLKEGKIGLLLQKGLATAGESAIQTASSIVPGLAALNLVSMAGGNYATETDNNPETEAWKRGVYAVGSAALEQAIEKFTNPFGGKAAKGLTKEVVDKVVAEGADNVVDNIANRIFNALGRTLKKVGTSAGGEGLEEIAAGVGTDALGQALDAIDKDDDYGFSAQWKQLKEENPDANLWEFAKQKGNEYWNAFLGGALSGAHMSTLPTAVREGLKEYDDYNNQKNLKALNEKGASLDYQNIYDVDDVVKENSDLVAQAFVNDEGESPLSEEFIAGLTSQDAYNLSRSEDITRSQRDALVNLAGAKAMQEGLTTKLNDTVEGEVNANRALMEGVTENGAITIAIHNGKPVYVMGASVKDGSVTLPNGNGGPVVIVDAKTGEKQSVDSKDLSGAEVRDAAVLVADAEASIRSGEQSMREKFRNTMSPLAKMKAVRPYTGKKILVDLGSGVIEVYVQQVSPKGDVLIKGKKGDLGGQSFLTLNSSTFYDSIHRDEDGNPTITDLGKEEQQQYDAINTTEEVQDADVDGTEDFKEEGTHTILIDGRPVDVEVTYQDNTSDTVNYEYVDENGNRKVGSTTVGGFKAAIQQAEQYKPTESPAPVNDTTAPVETTETNVPTETTQAPTEVPVTPEIINWDALLENDSEAFFAEMQSQFGEESIDYINAIVESTQDEINSLGKTKGKSTNQIIADKTRQKELQKKLDTLNGMIARLSAEPIAETNAAPAAEQVASQEQATAEPINEPNPTIQEPELVEPAKVEKDPEPRNAVEFAARELGLRDGGIKLLWESFKHHTGYGDGERSKFFGLFRKKDKGGMTLEAAGERLMELDREYNLGFFDQTDPNAGLNAILEALQFNSTIGELRSYTRRQYEADAQREADEYNAYILNAYNEALLAEEVALEDVAEKDLTEDEYNELITKFAEEIYDYEEANKRDALAVSEAEEIGDLPLATGETVRGGEGSNSILQETQPIQTRGEGTFNEESEGVDEHINREDADSPVYSGEPSVSEGVYQESESVSSLDEDMPDFTGESEQTPVAPNQVANPVAEAQKIEEHLIAQLVRDLSKEQKQDLAKSLGKKVADLFATREAYDEYQETATDFGAYNSYFDEGVENSFANRGNQYQISDDNLGVNSAAQQLTVDALMESLSGYIDIEVVSDEQVVKMLESSEPIELMGTRVNNRRNAIAQYFSGKQLSVIEQSIINAFANGAKNESIIITRNGTNKRIHLKQGSEPKAGVSHSILKHYDTASNNYTDSEILLIPNIIQNGTEVKNGKKISYKHTSNGVTYTVTTEIHDREENFTNFFTDRKPTTGNSSNTVKQHVHPQQSVSTANVSNNSITTNTGQNKNSLLRTIDGTVYGWTDGKKIYLTKAGINPNTPIHEYTHIWAKAMMKKNPKGWNRIKQLLKGTPIWNEVVNDPNYSNIKNDEDAIASEALSRISGSKNAAKMDKMAQKMIDEAKGTARKLEARGLIQNMKDALTKFWSWVGKNIFEIENFKNIDEVTDRVLYDLLNKTDLGTLSEGQVETQIVTDPQVIEELEASPKRAGFRNVVQNEDGTFSSPMAYWLQSTKEGAKSRVETAKFELGKWEEAEEHPELVDENGKITLVKPNKGTVDGVAYDPYIHNRLEPVNLQFKDAWKRDDLVYVETEVAETDLNDGYHADKALLPVGVHSWSNGDVMLSRYDKPVRVMPWEEVADAWVKRLNGEGVHFDVVPPAMRSLLVERGVEILPPHKGMGKKCNDAYAEWKKENEILSRKGENNTKFVEQFEFKQNNEQRELEYSDEFRRLQEESARMSGQLVSEKDGVQQTAIRELVGRIGGTLQRELDRAGSGRGYKLRTLVNDSKGTSFDIIENVDGRLFHDIFEIVRTYLPNGELVDLHDNYNDAICYITSDGLAGFAVDAKGNLISVFSLYGNSKKGFLGAIKDLITEAGATHLDGYNSPKQPLAKIYSKVFGWKVASMMDYNMEYDHDNIAENHEMPQVAFMVNTDADIETKHFDKDQYDEAVAYQQEQVEVNNRVDTQNAAVDRHSGKTRSELIQRAVNEEAAKLGVKVTYKTREEMPAGHKNDKGYYNPQTGEIVICTENATSIADAIKTILHEAVAHKGLRKLFGNRFDEFIRNVYDMLDAETKAKVDARAAAHYNGDTAVAMEEYMASLAENENFADQTIWEKIKSIFTNLINDILGRNDIKIGDNELRYILRASYNNMVNPRSMDTIEGWAKDQLMREEYKVNESTPEIFSRTGVDPNKVASETARQVYDRTVSSVWQEFQRQFQDAYQPVRVALDAIQQETGNMPIDDYENFLLVQNQMSSRSRIEIDNFERRHYRPIINQVNAIIDAILDARGLNIKDEAKRAEAYKEVINYLIAKHGLERNKYYQEHKTRTMTAKEMKPELDEAQADYQQKVDMINMNNNLSDAERELQLRDALDEYNAVVQEIKSREVPDMRDYSGLTSLFGLDSKEYQDAERMAQELVDDFEKSLGRIDDDATGDIVEQAEAIDKLWEKINKATDKTLRHSYESGLLSRQQYNDIKGMFKFYIPLRGFDDTTAEDVYAYARFEGNRFNPAVQTAKGRTSIADDPIATIMNMAESEIAQGNKNRAKQALYNYLLNRTIMGEDGKEQQNSLMQVEDVWYVNGVDSEGNEIYQIATPDRARGESWEEFEVRMQTMAEEGNAYKSKKGKLDVGMRFQKQRNKGAHYVYLKVNGVEKAIYINGDPKAADAINGTYRPETNAGVEKMRKLNRLVSSTFTNYSLEFTARNYFRDMIYSHINIGIKESDPAYRKKFRQNWRHNNLRTVKNMLQAYRNGEYEGRLLTEDEAAFVEFMENGGQTGYTLINSVETRKRELERAIRNMQNGTDGSTKDTKGFKALLGAIETLNESSEIITRFAAFKTSRDMGRSINKSISDAKEITVNFNTKGAQDGRGFLGLVARYFGWSKYFFNASVQGVQNIKAMAEANKLKFCSTVGGIAGLGFCMPIIAGALSELFGGDDDDENAYWNIPEYDRQNNLCIPVGNTYLKIPLPIGFREVYAIGDMVAAMAFDKKFTRDVSQVGMDIANKIASTVLPVNPLESSANGLSIIHSIAYVAAPSSAQFIIQELSNTDWKGAPLQKEYTYNENDPQWMKAYASNPEWMVMLSKWCNENTQFGDYEGWDWSPEKLDNRLSNMFGGIYTIVKKTGKTISMAWNEESRTTSNIPLAGVVLGSGIGSDDMFMTDTYYDMLEYYNSNLSKISRTAKAFDYDLDDVFINKKGQQKPKMQKDIYSNPTFEWMQEWYKGNKELEKYDKDVKELEQKIAETENPSEYQLEKLNRVRLKFESERRDFINDMLELD